MPKHNPRRTEKKRKAFTGRKPRSSRSSSGSRMGMVTGTRNNGGAPRFEVDGRAYGVDFKYITAADVAKIGVGTTVRIRGNRIVGLVSKSSSSNSLFERSWF